MPHFVCSYAYDITCFTDFVVEARNEKAALRQIQKALRDGRLEDVSAEPCWENGATNHRVFVQGVAAVFAPAITLAELTGRPHLFSPHTNVCVRCGQSAAADAIENNPCLP